MKTRIANNPPIRRRAGEILTSIWLLVIAFGASIPLQAGTVQYTYDALNRLSQVTYADGSTIAYGYDQVGNWTTNKVTIATDSVGNGIPDWWRALYFGGSGTTTNSQSCAACDPDGDGMSNLKEFLAGTDPKDPKNALRILLVQRSGTEFTFNVPTVSGRFYMVEYKNDLSDASWNPLTDAFDGTGGAIQIIDPGVAGISRRFYRIKLLQ